MKKGILYSMMLFIWVSIISFKTPEKITGEKILEKMYNRYHNKWYSTFTFDQTTESYRNDSLIRTATWHESIVFPDYFRISFGEISNGNAVIFRKDSSYNFNKGKLTRKGPRGEDLTFLLGGMYFIPFENVKSKMITEGYDITKACESTWQGKKVYVLGTTNTDDKMNQLWIDKQKLIVVRSIKYDGLKKDEAVFGDHVKFGKAWSETSCSFYSNDKLIQKEIYFNAKANTEIDMAVFDPFNFKY